jgi:hypothetical protein
MPNLAMLSIMAPLYYAKVCQPLIIAKIQLSFAVICSNEFDFGASDLNKTY